MAASELPDDVERQLLEVLAASAAERLSRLEELCDRLPDHAPQLRSRFAACLRSERALTERDDDALKQIGAYRILGVLGEGGMGTVYLAEQTEPVRRRVALKVIKLGMNSRQIVARFESERQALAMMEHSNIAKVFDAGTTERGQPYFVMEHVKGIPITDYCDQNRLTIAERIGLLRQVCSGVQHAHTKGVMHRDLKPSNVLVTVQDGAPVPKIIDFGLARATGNPLTEATLCTQQGQIIGTLEYMSPEQAGLSGLDVDTRTDVYSLGVMLYELLVGERPFSRHELLRAGLLEIQRKIREDEPLRPSTRASALGESAAHQAKLRRADARALVRALIGDLDWITMKAMDKDRTRRYQTAAELAADLDRHLRVEPVTAGPPSMAYRVRKLMRKYRLQVAAAAAVVLVLIAGVVATTLFAVRADRMARDARREAYFANIAAGWTALQARDFSSLRRWVEAAPEEWRNWEWSYLETKADEGSPLVLRGHEGIVSATAFSADGERIVTGSWDRTARVWDARSGDCIAVLRGHDGAVVAAAFSADGKRIVTGSQDKTCRIWDRETDQAVVLGAGEPVIAAVFSPDGTRILTGTRNPAIRVWRGGESEDVPFDRRDCIHAFVFDPAASRVAVGTHPNTTRIADANTGKLLVSLRGAGAEEVTVVTAAFSSDGSRLVAGATDGTARVWSTATGDELSILRGHGGWVDAAAFAPDGASVATGSGDGKVRLWDPASGNELARLLGHTGGVSAIAYSPDGQRLVSASCDGTARVWSTSLRGQTVLRGSGGSLNALAFDPDGARIAAACDDGTARVWNPATGDLLLVLRGHESSPDPEVSLIPGGPLRYGVTSVAFSPDGSRVATGSEDGTARVWSAANGNTLAVIRGHEGEVTAVSYSPDGSTIATGSGDKTGRLWNSASGAQLRVLKGHAGSVRSAAFSPDGTRIVTASDDRTARVWSAARGEELSVLRGHEDEVTAVAFSPDGARVVTASADGTARVWDASSGSAVSTLRGHAGRVASVAFNPDGSRIATGSFDETARLWDTATGREIVMLRQGTSAISAVAFSPDGTRLVTAFVDGSAGVWTARSDESRRD